MHRTRRAAPVYIYFLLLRITNKKKIYMYFSTDNYITIITTIKNRIEKILNFFFSRIYVLSKTIGFLFIFFLFCSLTHSNYGHY